MLLEDKNAVIYGAGGSIGGAVARALAREGARVFLVGRTREKLEAAASDICRGIGGGVRRGQPGFRSRTMFLPSQSRICVAAAAARFG